jgi:hypothetical protein
VDNIKTDLKKYDVRLWTGYTRHCGVLIEKRQEMSHSRKREKYLILPATGFWSSKLL